MGEILFLEDDTANMEDKPYTELSQGTLRKPLDFAFGESRLSLPNYPTPAKAAVNCDNHSQEEFSNGCYNLETNSQISEHRQRKYAVQQQQQQLFQDNLVTPTSAAQGSPPPENVDSIGKFYPQQPSFTQEINKEEEWPHIKEGSFSQELTQAINVVGASLQELSQPSDSEDSLSNDGENQVYRSESDDALKVREDPGKLEKSVYEKKDSKDCYDRQWKGNQEESVESNSKIILNSEEEHCRDVSPGNITPKDFHQNEILPGTEEYSKDKSDTIVHKWKGKPLLISNIQSLVNRSDDEEEDSDDSWCQGQSGNYYDLDQRKIIQEDDGKDDIDPAATDKSSSQEKGHFKEVIGQGLASSSDDQAFSSRELNKEESFGRHNQERRTVQDNTISREDERGVHSEYSNLDNGSLIRESTSEEKGVEGLSLRIREDIFYKDHSRIPSTQSAEDETDKPSITGSSHEDRDCNDSVVHQEYSEGSEDSNSDGDSEESDFTQHNSPQRSFTPRVDFKGFPSQREITREELSMEEAKYSDSSFQDDHSSSSLLQDMTHGDVFRHERSQMSSPENSYSSQDDFAQGTFSKHDRKTQDGSWEDGVFRRVSQEGISGQKFTHKGSAYRGSLLQGGSLEGSIRKRSFAQRKLAHEKAAQRRAHSLGVLAQLGRATKLNVSLPVIRLQRLQSKDFRKFRDIEKHGISKESARQLRMQLSKFKKNARRRTMRKLEMFAKSGIKKIKIKRRKVLHEDFASDEFGIKNSDSEKEMLLQKQLEKSSNVDVNAASPTANGVLIGPHDWSDFPSKKARIMAPGTSQASLSGEYARFDGLPNATPTPASLRPEPSSLPRLAHPASLPPPLLAMHHQHWPTASRQMSHPHVVTHPRGLSSHSVLQHQLPSPSDQLAYHGKYPITPPMVLYPGKMAAPPIMVRHPASFHGRLLPPPGLTPHSVLQPSAPIVPHPRLMPAPPGVPFNHPPPLIHVSTARPNAGIPEDISPQLPLGSHYVSLQHARSSHSSRLYSISEAGSPSYRYQVSTPDSPSVVQIKTETPSVCATSEDRMKPLLPKPSAESKALPVSSVSLPPLPGLNTSKAVSVSPAGVAGPSSLVIIPSSFNLGSVGSPRDAKTLQGEAPHEQTQTNPVVSIPVTTTHSGSSQLYLLLTPTKHVSSSHKPETVVKSGSDSSLPRLSLGDMAAPTSHAAQTTGVISHVKDTNVASSCQGSVPAGSLASQVSTSSCLESLLQAGVSLVPVTSSSVSPVFSSSSSTTSKLATAFSRQPDSKIIISSSQNEKQGNSVPSECIENTTDSFPTTSTTTSHPATTAPVAPTSLSPACVTLTSTSSWRGAVRHSSTEDGKQTLAPAASVHTATPTKPKKEKEKTSSEDTQRILEIIQSIKAECAAKEAQAMAGPSESMQSGVVAKSAKKTYKTYKRHQQKDEKLIDASKAFKKNLSTSSYEVKGEIQLKHKKPKVTIKPVQENNSLLKIRAVGTWLPTDSVSGSSSSNGSSSKGFHVSNIENSEASGVLNHLETKSQQGFNVSNLVGTKATGATNRPEVALQVQKSSSGAPAKVDYVPVISFAKQDAQSTSATVTPQESTEKGNTEGRKVAVPEFRLGDHKYMVKKVPSWSSVAMIKRKYRQKHMHPKKSMKPTTEFISHNIIAHYEDGTSKNMGDASVFLKKTIEPPAMPTASVETTIRSAEEMEICCDRSTSLTSDPEERPRSPWETTELTPEILMNVYTRRLAVCVKRLHHSVVTKNFLWRNNLNIPEGLRLRQVLRTWDVKRYIMQRGKTRKVSPLAMQLYIKKEGRRTPKIGPVGSKSAAVQEMLMAARFGINEDISTPSTETPQPPPPREAKQQPKIKYNKHHPANVIVRKPLREELRDNEDTPEPEPLSPSEEVDQTADILHVSRKYKLHKNERLSARERKFAMYIGYTLAKRASRNSALDALEGSHILMEPGLFGLRGIKRPPPSWSQVMDAKGENVEEPQPPAPPPPVPPGYNAAQVPGPPQHYPPHYRPPPPPPGKVLASSAMMPRHSYALPTMPATATYATSALPRHNYAAVSAPMGQAGSTTYMQTGQLQVRPGPYQVFTTVSSSQVAGPSTSLSDNQRYASAVMYQGRIYARTVYPSGQIHSGQIPAHHHSQSGQIPPQAHSQSGQVPPQVHIQSGQMASQSHVKSAQVPPQAHNQSGQLSAQSHVQSGQIQPQGHHIQSGQVSQQSRIQSGQMQQQSHMQSGHMSQGHIQSGQIPPQGHIQAVHIAQGHIQPGQVHMQSPVQSGQHPSQGHNQIPQAHVKSGQIISQSHGHSGQIPSQSHLQPNQIPPQARVQTGQVLSQSHIQAGQIPQAYIQSGQMSMQNHVQSGHIPSQSHIQSGQIQSQASVQSGQIPSPAHIQSGHGHSHQIALSKIQASHMHPSQYVQGHLSHGHQASTAIVQSTTETSPNAKIVSVDPSGRVHEAMTQGIPQVFSRYSPSTSKAENWNPQRPSNRSSPPPRLMFMGNSNASVGSVRDSPTSVRPQRSMPPPLSFMGSSTDGSPRPVGNNPPSSIASPPIGALWPGGSEHGQPTSRNYGVINHTRHVMPDMQASGLPHNIPNQAMLEQRGPPNVNQSGQAHHVRDQRSYNLPPGVQGHAPSGHQLPTLRYVAQGQITPEQQSQGSHSQVPQQMDMLEDAHGHMISQQITNLHRPSSANQQSVSVTRGSTPSPVMPSQHSPGVPQRPQSSITSEQLRNLSHSFQLNKTHNYRMEEILRGALESTKADRKSPQQSEAEQHRPPSLPHSTHSSPAQPASGTPSPSPKRMHTCTTKNTPEVLAVVEALLLQLIDVGLPSSSNSIIQAASQLIQARGIDNPFCCSADASKWYTSFHNTHSHRLPLDAGEEGFALPSEMEVQKWVVKLKVDMVKFQGVPASRVYYMQELNFFLDKQTREIKFHRMFPGKIHCSNEKDTVSVLFILCADGQVGPGMIIFPRMMIPEKLFASLRNTEEGKDWVLGSSMNGWLYSDCISEFVSDAFVPWLNKQNVHFPIALFVNELVSNIPLTRMCDNFFTQGIQLITVPTVMSRLLSPAELIVAEYFRTKWGKAVNEWSAQNNSKPLLEENFAPFITSSIKTQAVAQQVCSMFSERGLCPFNPQVIFQCLRCPTSAVRGIASTEPQ